MFPFSYFRAHKLYPVRVRLVNATTGEESWHTVAYVPAVATEKGLGGVDLSRQQRAGTFQRVLYLTLRGVLGASQAGVPFRIAAGRELLTFPHLLMYICDQLGERNILCMKQGQCHRPCTSCDAPLEHLASAAALSATQRAIINTLYPEMEAAAQLRLML